jgi:hypothetical protein
MARVNTIKLSTAIASPSLSDFAIHKGGTDKSVAIQNAINSVYDAGDHSLFIPPGEYGIDVAANITLPQNIHIHGIKGASKFQGLGTNYPNNPTFPSVGGGLLNLGNRTTAQRYGTQTGRMASGTGATFNLVMTGSAPNLSIVSATVASGGTGYNVGDAINITGGQLIVSAISGTAYGAITTVTVGSPGTYAVAPTNPVAQTTSFGNRIQDRILDPSSFAEWSKISGIVFDGGYTSGILSTTKTLFGVKFVGCLDIEVTDCEFNNFPHSGVFCNDVKRRTLIGNKFKNLGFGGTAGTGTAAADRNGATVGGIYVRTNPSLNGDLLEYAFNEHENIKGSGVEFHYTDAHVHNNTFRQIYEIGIEGQAAGFNVLDTVTTNGGVYIPGDAHVHDNILDGKMADGSIGMTVGAISLSDGNENTKIVARNKIKNTDTYAVAVQINNNGHVTVEDTEGDNVNMATIVSSLQCIYIAAEDVRCRRNRLSNVGRCPFIYVSTFGTQEISITDNDLNSAGGNSNSAIFVQIARNRTLGVLNISRNIINSCPLEAILVEVAGSSTLSIRELQIANNQIYNHTRLGTTTSAIRLRTNAGSTFNFNIGTIHQNTIYENSLRTVNGTAPIKLEQSNSSAPNKLIIDRNLGTGYTVAYDVSGMAVAPTVTGTNDLA